MLALKSFQLGEFRLSSGQRSDYYVDCRTTTLDAEGARLTGEAVLETIRERGWQPQAIGGTTLGADPIVAAVAALSAGRIHGFLVRKAEKTHGTGQRIEGFRDKGARVVIVDDVCTTGASTIHAIEAARQFSFEIAGILCLVEREEGGGRSAVEQAAGMQLVALFTAGEIRREYERLRQETPAILAASARCEMCNRPAVTSSPRNRCAAHRA